MAGIYARTPRSQAVAALPPGRRTDVSTHPGCGLTPANRGHEVVLDMLDGFSGVLMVDDYAAYQEAKKLLPNNFVVLCWSHVRGGFVDALESYPELEHVVGILLMDT